MIDDVPCTLHYEGNSLDGILMAYEGKLGDVFILRRPRNESFWVSLPRQKLECTVTVEGVTYNAIFAVASSVPIHTLSNVPPRKITSITGKIIDESFKSF